MDLTINTPALLFPAISLLMLAYTNRFLAMASLIRNLHTKFLLSRENEKTVKAQIKNLKLRIKLIKYMQGLGVLCIFFCVLCMALLYVNYTLVAQIIFGLSLLIFLASLTLSLIEINISTEALELELSDMEEH